MEIKNYFVPLYIMRIELTMMNHTAPIIFKNVEQGYTRDGLYCVYTKKRKKIYQFPLCNIYKIEVTKD